MEISFGLTEKFSVIRANPFHELSFFLFTETVKRVHSLHALFESLFSAVSLRIFAQVSAESFPVVVTESLFDVL